MTRGERIATNCIIIILLHFFAWQFNYYPRHIVEFESPRSIVSVIFNLAYFIVYSYLLIVVFSKNRCFNAMSQTESRLPFAKKFEVKRVALLVLCQIALDGVLLLYRHLNFKWLYPAMTLTLVLYWIVLYIALADKAVAIWKNPKTLWITVVVMVAAVAFFLYVDFVFAKTLSELTARYYPEFSTAVVKARNVEHAWKYKTYILDTLMLLLFSVMHHLNVAQPEKPENKGTVRAMMVVNRAGLFGLALVFAIALKDGIAPQGNLEIAYVEKNQREFIEGLYGQETRLSNDRNDVNGESKECIEASYYEISDGEGGEIRFVYDRYLENETPMPQGKIYYSDGDISAVVYYSKAICYHEYGKAKAVLLSDLADSEESYILTKVCRKILQEGRMNLFEYVCDYLYKYDREFIEPYIERYSQGKFTATETTWMSTYGYRKGYVIEVANRF